MYSTTSNKYFPVIYVDNYLIVKLPKKLTLLESNDFKKIYFDLCRNIQINQNIVIDLSNTQFIDSSGIGVLVQIHQNALNHNFEVVLQQVQPPVMKILEISGLVDIFLLQPKVQCGSKDNFVTHPSINSKLKRLIDLTGAIIGLGITIILYLPIAISIKIDTPGPILFRQTRCGWLGQKFSIWKFRSMCVEAETMQNNIPNQAKGAFFKNDLDPRITKVGRFLRRTSLDELPQFWNVLKGDMSLVGTRPPTIDEVNNYRITEWQRLNVKPGMTGEWQVNGRSNIRNFEDVIKLDLNYQKKWTVQYDIILILKTIAVIFSKNSGGK